MNDNDRMFLTSIANKNRLKNNENKVYHWWSWFSDNYNVHVKCLICNKFIDNDNSILSIEAHGINHIKNNKLKAFI